MGSISCTAPRALQAQVCAGYDSPGAHALPRESGKPCRGRPGILNSAIVLFITFTLLSWGATWHALALNLGGPAIF